MKIKKLFLHDDFMQPAEKLVLNNEGIEGNKYGKIFSPRQVLITNSNVYEKYNLEFGTLKENIIIDSEDILDLGDILNIGKAKIRLTYFCEGCYKLGLEKNILKNIGQQRGILGIIITPGEIKINDKIILEKNKFEKFPFETKERFLLLQKKLLEKEKFVSYSDAIFLLGLPKGFLRAIKGYKTKYNLENILEKEKIKNLEKSKIFSAQEFWF